MSVAHLPLPPAPASDWALFLDVDGSLLDIAPHPDHVHVPDDLVDALARVRRALGGALALVSGRTLQQLDALFSPLRLPAAGLHGLQLRDEGDAAPALASPPPALRALREAGASIVQRFPGALVEDKGETLALHWRGAPEAADAMRELAQAGLAALPHYRVQPGDHVLELRPDGFDKGTAIRHLLDTGPFRGRLPVFVGDDLTDEHGFAAVNALGGHSVLVGMRAPSVARFRLDNPQALRAWLLEAADRLTPAHEVSA